MQVLKVAPPLKLNEHYEISFRYIKNYSDETFVDKLRSVKFPDYSNHTCDIYQDFVTKFYLHLILFYQLELLK